MHRQRSISRQTVKSSTPLDTVSPGKQEMGPLMSMAKASSLGKEWNEQANDLADYVIGKTVEEVKGIGVTEDGVPHRRGGSERIRDH